jgi:hypothetical protein
MEEHFGANLQDHNADQEVEVFSTAEISDTILELHSQMKQNQSQLLQLLSTV